MKYFFLSFFLLFMSACSSPQEVPEAQNTQTNTQAISNSVTSAPVNITVVDCRNCGAEEAVKQLKEKVLKQAVIKEVDQNSEDGQRLIQKFSAKTLPLIVFDEGIKNGEVQSFYKDITQEVDNEFLLLPDTVGLQIGKELISSPAKNDFDYRTSGTQDSFVQIIEFSDFECPFCAKFYRETYGKIKEKYGDKVSFTFKNFPLEFHKFAQKSAEAVQCAGDQKKFSEMHDILFQNNENLSVADLKSYAAEIGLDTEGFNSCLDSGEKVAEVAQQMKDGQEIGVTGTPAFVINGKTFVGGAYPFEYFESILDDMLGLNQKL